MNFKNWIVFNENVDSNWDFWCDTLEKYAEKNPAEKRVLNSLRDMLLPIAADNVWSLERGGRAAHMGAESLTLKDFLNFKGVGYTSASVKAKMVSRVLKSKSLENYNWFCFSLGCIVSYNGSIGEEDLESAIDETKRRIDSRELTKSEIGAKGWLVIGSESKRYVDEAILRSQEISKRKQLKLKKQGLTLNEDPELIEIFSQRDEFILYFCPKLKDSSSEIANKRHAILCKYGKGGKFCTASPTGTHHRMYINNDIYIFHVNNKVKYQFVSCYDRSNQQFHNIDNKHPDEIEKEEKQFLIDSNAPISCYNLKTAQISYEDFMKVVKSYPKNKPGWREKLGELSTSKIEKYLIKSLDFGKEDVFLLINAILKDTSASDSLRDAMNIGINPMINLKDFLNSLKDLSFCQEVIREIIKHFENKHNSISIFTFSSDSLSLMLEISEIENLEKLLSFKRVASSLSLNSFAKILKSNVASESEKIKLLSKVETLPSEIIAYLLAISEDKKEVCDNLKASGSIEKLSEKNIIDLLKGTLEPLREVTWRDVPKDKLPGVEIKDAGIRMAEILGKEVLRKIKDPGVIARFAAKLDGSPRGKLAEIGVLSNKEAKNLIEALCRHPELSNEDVSGIMQAYKELGIHKWKEKISSFLGNKNLKKLNRMDRAYL